MASIVAHVHNIEKNLRWFLLQAEKSDLTLTAVTKFCTSDPDIVAMLYSAGIRSIADSNLKNFSRFVPLDMRKNLIKARLSDIASIPLLPKEDSPDRVFISDPTLLYAIRTLSPDRQPEIVLIAEVGDFKEGMTPKNIRKSVEEFSDLPIIGVSANFACLSGALPSINSIKLLHILALEIMKIRGLNSPFVSIGGTVVWDLLFSGALKGLVSEIRIGEGIFFGFNSSGNSAIPGLCTSCFTLKGEIMEISTKKIEQPNNQGYNALGNHDVVRKTGERTCAILDFGVLAGALADLTPLDPAIFLAGQTFDFTVVDITESPHIYTTGGYISFRVMYSGASQACLNPYIERSLSNEAQQG